MTDEQVIKYTRHSKSVLQSFQELRSQGELCDFIITSQGYTFKTHKALLAATSEYFRVLLRGMMQESKNACVKLDSLSASSVRQILDFIYSGEISLNKRNLTDAIHTASHLQCSMAIAACCQFIISILSFENADEFLNLADTYSLHQVEEHWDAMVLGNFEEYSGTPNFFKASSDVLCKYLSSNSLQTKSEYKVFQSADVWIKKRISPTVSDAEKILSLIRFGLMSHDELKLAQSSVFVSFYTPTLKYINNGLYYHSKAKDGHPYIGSYCEIRANEKSLVFVHHSTSPRIPFRITAKNSQNGRFYELFTDSTGSRDCLVTVYDNFAYFSRIIDCGGGALMNSLIRFDPRHLTVVSLRCMHNLRMDYAFITFNEYLYAIGGWNDNFFPLSSIERYSISANQWEELAVHLPTPLYSHAAVATRDAIFLSGGLIMIGSDRIETNNFYRFDPQHQTWKQMTSMFYARRLHHMMVFENSIYILGGMPRPNVQQQLQGQIAMERYDFASDQWTVLSTTFSGRSFGHFTVYNKQLISLGHEHIQAAEDELWVYDTLTCHWTFLSKVPSHHCLSSSVSIHLSINFNDDRVSSNICKISS